MWTFCYVFIRKQWFQRQKSLSNYKGNLGKIAIGTTINGISPLLEMILTSSFFLMKGLDPIPNSCKNERSTSYLQKMGRVWFKKPPPRSTLSLYPFIWQLASILHRVPSFSIIFCNILIYKWYPDAICNPNSGICQCGNLRIRIARYLCKAGNAPKRQRGT